MSRFKQDRNFDELLEAFDNHYIRWPERRIETHDENARCYSTFSGDEAAEYYTDCAAAVPRLIKHVRAQDELISLLAAQVSLLSQFVTQVQAIEAVDAATRENRAHRMELLDNAQNINVEQEINYTLASASHESSSTQSSTQSSEHHSESSDFSGCVEVEHLLTAVRAHVNSASTSQKARALAEAVANQHEASAKFRVEVSDRLRVERR